MEFYKSTGLSRAKRHSVNLARSGPNKKTKHLNRKPKIIFLLALGLLVILWQVFGEHRASRIKNADYIPPLVMTGGDPYIRALMRTISESEANASNPYTLLYGGEQISDLSRHPNQCVTIVSGPHKG